jgi:hypothetical protein
MLFTDPKTELFTRPKSHTDQHSTPAPEVPPLDLSFDLSFDPTPTSKPKYTAGAGLVSLRMSRKAKRRISELHAKHRISKQEAFRKLLEQCPQHFEPEQLSGHDCKESLNVKLSAEQLATLRTLAASHRVAVATITSALVMMGGKL